MKAANACTSDFKLLTFRMQGIMGVGWGGVRTGEGMGDIRSYVLDGREPS